MKSVYFYIIILVSFFGFSQNTSIQFDWGDTDYQVGRSVFKIRSVSNYSYTYHPSIKSIDVHFSLDVDFPVNEKAFFIKNLKTKRLNKKYVDLDFSGLSATPIYHIETGKSEKGVSNVLIINPFVKKGKDIHQIISFDYEAKNMPNQRMVSSSDLLTVSNSVLASGDWFKIKVNKTGVYKISYSFLKEIGIPDGVDPRTIRVYGFGGRMLPLPNGENKYFDLPELAIYASGESDGNLNPNDYFYFYAQGTEHWNSEVGTHLNIYQNSAYYYITYGTKNGKRIQQFTDASGNVTETFTDFDERVFHEVDITNIAQVSRRWVGESFSNSFVQNHKLNLPQLQPNTTATLSGRAVASSTMDSEINIRLNGQAVTSISFLPIQQSYFKAYEKSYSYKINNPQENNQVSLVFDNKGFPSGKGYNDFVAIDYTKKLSGYGKQFGFRKKNLSDLGNVVKFQISSAANISQVWDVSDPINPKNKLNTLSNNEFSLKFIAKDESEFVAINTSDLYVPEYVNRQNNQNLKGTIFDNGAIDYLIITSSLLMPQAQRLAQFHKENQKLNTKVVNVKDIYNEFSSGQTDIVAIRNFVRYVYANSPNPNKRLKYLNLFGEVSYDYKNLTGKSNNIIPTFHYISLNQTSNYSDQFAYSTDDFYALLDGPSDTGGVEEGEMVSQYYTGLDVAVGRMLAGNIDEARQMVDKVVAYYNKNNIGSWKLNSIMLADDIDYYSDKDFQVELNEVSDLITTDKPYFNIKKIFLDAYKQESTAGGQRYPQAKTEFYNGIESGALVINYLGHGGYNGLAGERMMDIPDIQNLNNPTRLPLFVIVTCEFTKYDDHNYLSGGERLLKKTDGGAISLIATSRKIGINNAKTFSVETNKYIFNVEGVSEDNVAPAEALRQVKNANTSLGEKGVVSYLGDPALKLSTPKVDVVLNKINGENINQYNGHIRALDYVNFEGRVQNENGVLLSDFNGKLSVQIFDKENNRKTFGNDNSFIYEFKTLGATIFRGNVEVKNGKFILDFIVPKDIKQEVGKGKINFYAQRNSEFIDDYAGADTSVKIGGINPDAKEDNQAPLIRLFMNDENFVNGSITNASPIFLVKMEDEHGINTAGGIGHDLVAILDGDESNPIILNDFYETELNDYKKGIINYPFKNLSKGKHHILFKAWDSYNNMSSDELEFYVDETEGIILDNVLNYPNPFINYTEFWFEHNKPNQALEVQVQILTITGKIVKTINRKVIATGFNCREITWDGKDDFGSLIAKGVYIYRLKVKSSLTGETAEKIEKIVKL